MSRLSMSPDSPKCEHHVLTDEPCYLCGKPLCETCSHRVMEAHGVCANCAPSVNPDHVDDSETVIADVDSLLDIRKAPISGGFCILLILLYAVSAMGYWVHSDPYFLVDVTLDRQAILEDHEYWRLLTGNLFHANLAHIGANVFSILIFGTMLEIQIKRRALLLWIFLAMLACDLMSLAFGVERSVGASGVGYGLQTGFIILTGKIMIQNRLQDIGKTLQSLFGYLILMILLGFVYTENINVAGHFGGALAGLVCAAVYPVTRPFKTRDFWVLIALNVLVLAKLISIVV